MQLADFSSSSPQLVYGEKQGFLKYPREYLSTEETSRLLKSNKVVLLEPEELHCDSCWTTALLTALAVGLIGGVFVFTVVANAYGHIDHSNDRETSYYCKGKLCDDLNKNHHYQMLSKNGYWIDHSEDRWAPNDRLGLMAYLLTSLTPPGLLLLVWIICRIFSRVHIWKENKAKMECNEILDELNIRLQSASEIKSSTPTPAILIEELSRIGLLSDDHKRQLSFAQMMSIEKELKFDQQNILWSKFRMMVCADADKLTAALNHRDNKNLFLEEPALLEILIQELDAEKLTESVKKALEGNVSACNNELGKLESNALCTMIDVVNGSRCSLEEAYKRQFLLSLKTEQVTTFKLTDENQNEVLISAPTYLLSTSSNVFNKMLSEEGFAESKKECIPLEDVDPDAFRELVSYLETGRLNLEAINLVSLLQVANQFHIQAPFALMEFHLCNESKHLLNEYDPSSLLELCEACNLSVFKKALDLRLSQNIPSFLSEEFVEFLQLIMKFSLSHCLSELPGTICPEMKELSTDHRFIAGFVETVEICGELLEELFPTFVDLVKKRPSLLRSLWEEAKGKSKAISDKIRSFNRKNPALVLECGWVIPPSEEPDSSTSSEEAWESDSDSEEPLLEI